MSRAVFIIAMVLGVPAPAGAWVYYETNGGDTVRWPSGGPCTIAFQYHPGGIESIPGMKEFTAFEDAMDAWNDNPCTEVHLALDGVDDACAIYAFPGSDQNCIVVSPDLWDHDDFGAAMMTVLSYKPSTGFLQDVDIDVNEMGFDFSLCEDGEEEPWVDYQYAAAHELGHVYGLDHPTDADCEAMAPEERSIMCSDGAIYCGGGKPHGPRGDDLAGVCGVYSSESYLCDDSPPEPAPEPVADLVAEPNPEPGPADVDGGSGGGGTCDRGAAPSAGAAVILFFLACNLLLRRRRTA